MGRVIAVGPGGKAQAPERDDRARPVIDFVMKYGMLDQLLLSPPCKNYDDAVELKRALFRSAKYYCSCGRHYCTRKWGNIPGQREDNPDGGCPQGGQRISCRADVVQKEDGEGNKTIHVQFQFHDKREAMRSVIEKYGPDPNKWPYNPRSKKRKG